MKQKTKLALAVTAALGASVPAVQAVNIAEDGLGEVGLYSYYTARGTYDTNIGVINTSDETVLVKVRFREYYNSRDARDFLVVLSPYDMWQAVVTRNNAGTAARVLTADRTCTVPISIRDGGPGATFTNQLFDDGGPSSLERTKEGHIEIISMGNSRCAGGNCNPATDPVAYYSTHTGPYGAREPRSCSQVEQQFTGANITATALQFDEPENVLKFSADIINVANGTAFSYDPVTLANFYNPLDPFIDATCLVNANGPACNLVRVPSSVDPDLTDVTPTISNIHTNTAGVSLTSNWGGIGPNIPVDAVSALFMRTNLLNQFRTAPGIGDTDFVVTMPTKNFYVDLPLPIDPFPQEFGPNHDPAVVGLSSDKAGACIDVVYTPTDTEETRVDDPEGVPPSPAPPEGQNARICREANVIEINDQEGEGGVLDGSPAYAVATGFDAGWLNINLQPARQLATDLIATNIISDEGHIYNGVPVTGFGVTELNNLNPAVPGGSTTYGKLWDHAYRRNIISQ